MEVGNVIKKMRFKASMTQEQLAEKLGISPQSVSKWENNVSMPDIGLLPSIAEVFDISLMQLAEDITKGNELWLNMKQD